MHEDAATVAADGGAARADGAHVVHYVCVFVDNLHQRELVLTHTFEGNILAGLGDSKHLAVVFAGKEALRDIDKKSCGRYQNDGRDEHGGTAVTQDKLQAAIILSQHAIEKTLRGGRS